MGLLLCLKILCGWKGSALDLVTRWIAAMDARLALGTVVCDSKDDLQK